MEGAAPCRCPRPARHLGELSSDDQVSALGGWDSPGQERKVKKRSSQQEEENGRRRPQGRAEGRAKGSGAEDCLPARRRGGKGKRVHGVGRNLVLTFPGESGPAPSWGSGRRLTAAAGTGWLQSSAWKPRPLAIGRRASCCGCSWRLAGTWEVGVSCSPGVRASREERAA